MLRLISRALVALALLAGPAAAQSFTLPELGLQNSGACRQLAARDRTSNAMIALGCLDTVGKGWKLTPQAIQIQGAGSTGDVSLTSVKLPYASSPLLTLQEFILQRVNIKFYGAKGDGVTDDGPAIQAAINDCNGCAIDVPPAAVEYRIGTCLTGKGGLRWRGQSSVGSNIHAAPATGSIISNFCNGPLLTQLGSSNLISNDASSWSSEGMVWKGNNRPFAIISAPEANPGRGSWSARINNTVFDGGRPAIYAANAWDWWIDGSSFQRCGDITKPDNAVGADLTDSCILIYNSAQTYAGANSNSWRITNNFFDITKGRGIVSDSSGAGGANQFMLISGNHFGPTGNESLYGCFSQSTITDNFSEGSFAGRPGINLFVPGNRGGCGQNRITTNLLTAAGTFHIVDGLAGDLIANNTMQPQGTGGAFVQLTASAFRTSVLNNKTLTSAGDTSVPMVSDSGTATTVRGNASSDNQIANNEEPFKADGLALWGQLSPQSGLTAYIPNFSCGTGSLGNTTGSFARYKRNGPMMYVALTLIITDNGTCGQYIKFNLPGTTAQAGSIRGVEQAGGKMLAARFGSGQSDAFINLPDGTSYPGFSGATITANDWFQAQ